MRLFCHDIPKNIYNLILKEHKTDFLNEIKNDQNRYKEQKSKRFNLCVFNIRFEPKPLLKDKKKSLSFWDRNNYLLRITLA